MPDRDESITLGEVYRLLLLTRKAVEELTVTIRSFNDALMTERGEILAIHHQVSMLETRIKECPEIRAQIVVSQIQEATAGISGRLAVVESRLGSLIFVSWFFLSTLCAAIAYSMSGWFKAMVLHLAGRG